MKSTKRPPLATLICIYEVGALMVSLLSSLLLTHLYRLHNTHPLPIPVALSAIRWLSLALAPLAVMALWKVKRSAYFLLLTRFLLGATWIVAYRMNTQPPRHKITLVIFYFVGVAILSLSGAIAWYANRITSPEEDAPPLVAS